MSAETHNLQPFDEEKGYWVRQTTDTGNANCWQVCKRDGDNVEVLADLNDDEFEDLRDIDKENPKGL